MPALTLLFQATDDDSVLIVANTGAGKIFTVDPDTGTAALIDLGGVLVYGDGLVRCLRAACHGRGRRYSSTSEDRIQAVSGEES